MSVDEFISKTVENFLVEQHNNLIQDRQALSTLLKQILEQQIISCSDVNTDVSQSNSDIVDDVQLDNSVGNEHMLEAKQVSRIEHREYLSTPEDHDKLRDNNGQTEKEKLAALFENSQFTFLTKSTSCRYRKNSKQSARDKENVNSDQVSGNELKKTPTRFGEFSPLNPSFQCNNKILGLGEYEELRKIFLNRKRKEYVNYLNETVKNTEMQYTKNNPKSSDKKINFGRKFVENNSSSASTFRNLPCENKNLMSDMKKHQQEIYRHELDKQIEEKKRLQLAQEEKERRICELWQHEDAVKSDIIMKNIESKFAKKIHYNNLKEKNLDAANMTSINKDFTRCSSAMNLNANPSKSACKRNISISSSFGSPILKPTIETCAIDNYEAYQKMQQELYKQDLVNQIREKRTIERDRRLKELEMEKKIEENARKAEEKLREQFEREQAERQCRATQRAHVEKQLFENLNRIQKQEDEKKKTKKLLQSKTCGIYPTNHRVDERHKNVTFLPHTIMYPICESYSSEIKCDSPIAIEMEKACESGTMILQAPYVLAVKDSGCNLLLPHSAIEKTCRPPSPVLPAVKTRNLINSLCKSDQLEIPPGVSMSEQTKTKFIRDDRILGNLSEIRRKLLENQPKPKNNDIF